MQLHYNIPSSSLQINCQLLIHICFYCLVDYLFNNKKRCMEYKLIQTLFGAVTKNKLIWSFINYLFLQLTFNLIIFLVQLIKIKIGMLCNKCLIKLFACTLNPKRVLLYLIISPELQLLLINWKMTVFKTGIAMLQNCQIIGLKLSS